MKRKNGGTNAAENKRICDESNRNAFVRLCQALNVHATQRSRLPLRDYESDDVVDYCSGPLSTFLLRSRRLASG